MNQSYNQRDRQPSTRQSMQDDINSNRSISSSKSNEPDLAEDGLAKFSDGTEPDFQAFGSRHQNDQSVNSSRNPQN